jgi:hypothetical protein
MGDKRTDNLDKKEEVHIVLIRSTTYRNPSFFYVHVVLIRSKFMLLG